MNEQAVYKFTLAHEIGHVVTNNLHYGDDYGDGLQHQVNHNLMRDGTSSTNQIISSKRLYDIQYEMLFDAVVKEY
jgi:hypothetical protein